MLKNRFLAAFAIAGLIGFAACAEEEPEVAEEPVLEEPVLAEPAVEPVVTEPVVTEPVGTEPIGAPGATTDTVM